MKFLFTIFFFDLKKITVRHGREDGTDALRTWDLQASDDGKVWTSIRSHENDTALTGGCFFFYVFFFSCLVCGVFSC